MKTNTVTAPVVTPANYTSDELQAYLEYQKSGKSTKIKYFGQPVGETNFTKDDRAQIIAARKEHRLMFAAPARKQEVIAAIRRKDHVITGHRVNVLGNKKVVRITDTSIAVPKKTPLKLVKTPKARAPKAPAPVVQAEPTAIAPAPAQTT